MNHKETIDWRSIVALNFVSTLAQIGQFGFGFVALPLWLAAKHLSATEMGFVASFEWAGMLAGLTATPLIAHRIGARTTIVIGILTSVAAYAVFPFGTFPNWLVASAVIGLGLGLRWVGLEPWLYGLAPKHAQGRVVGFHETLMGLAPIVAPALVGWIGIDGPGLFALAIGFNGVAILPIVLARPLPKHAGQEEATHTHADTAYHGKSQLLVLGLVIGAIGGLLESALAGLFPLFAAGRGLSSTEIAWLVSIFGLGGLLMQFPIGWLADHRGLAWTSSLVSIGAGATALTMAPPLDPLAWNLAMFTLGGCVTAYLTLAIIGATSAGGNLSTAISRISIAYTGSSIFGPAMAGMAMNLVGTELLVWQTGLLALGLSAYIVIRRRRFSDRD